MRRVLPLVFLAIAIPLGLPSAADARQCRTFHADGRTYDVSGSDNVGCRFMRKWSKRVVLREGHPRGLDCNRGWRSGGCNKGAGFDRKFFTYFPPH